MIHRSTIQRNQAAAERTTWNTPVDPDYQDHLTDQPCRLIWRSNLDVRTPEQDASVDRFTFLLPLGTDVTTADVVTEIRKRDGSVLFSGYGEIVSLQPLNQDLHLVCRKVSGPDGE